MFAHFDQCLVNFLAHFYFYRSGDAYYNTGLVLPDLVRSFCKDRLKLKTQYLSPEFESLKDGSLAHIEADRIFHQSAFFKTAESYIGDRLDADARWPRKWFLNHLLVEIALDRALMDLHPKLCQDFYDELGRCDASLISEFLKASDVSNYEQFTLAFTRFVSFAFIFDYQYNEKIVLALSRVYQRSGIQYEWTENDRNMIVGQLPGIISAVKSLIPKLEDELKITRNIKNK